MDIEEKIQEALGLLTQMSEYPHETLAALQDNTEREEVLTALVALAAQTDMVQNDSDLLKLTTATYHLVRNQPGLSALFALEVEGVQEEQQREVTRLDLLAATSQKTYTQIYAPQIRNAVIECREHLEAALRAAKQTDSTRSEKHL